MTLKKFNIAITIALILTIVGSGLLIGGFLVPPLGVIDSSILVAYGETLTFVGTVLGIKYTYKWKEQLSNKNRNSEDNV